MQDEIADAAEAVPIENPNRAAEAAYAAFAAAYEAMRKARNHETEREAVKHLADCIAEGEVRRETYHRAWDLLDRLAEDETGAWTELFGLAVDACVQATAAWSALKRCYRRDAEIRVEGARVIIIPIERS